jgi:hypothetical protein
MAPSQDSRRRSASTTCADARPRDHLDPPWMRSRRHLLGVVTTVNAMAKAMPAHASYPSQGPACGEYRLCMHSSWRDLMFIDVRSSAGTRFPVPPNDDAPRI